MEIDLSKYTIKEISELRDMCKNYLENHLDGYVYICKVRSYGRTWNEFVGNEFTLQELCYRYFGEDGIVDVYSNNPNLSLVNYGETMFIESKEDYERWKYYNLLVQEIKNFEEDWEKWDNRMNLQFWERPTWEPYCTKGELDLLRKELAEYDMSFIPPRPYYKNDDEEVDVRIS